MLLASLQLALFLGSSLASTLGNINQQLRWRYRWTCRVPRADLGVKDAASSCATSPAREQGLGVIFITHNVHHAWAIGDTFTLLSHGRSEGTFRKDETSRDQVVSLMAGGAALEELEHELGKNAPPSAHT